LSCSSTPIDYIHTTKLVLHQQTYNETSTKNRIENQTSPYLDIIIGSVCLSIPSLDT
jgi:hypothetical protein